MKWEKLPRVVRKKIAPNWFSEQAAKLYFKCPKKVQYLLAKRGARIALDRKRSQILEFMNE